MSGVEVYPYGRMAGLASLLVAGFVGLGARLAYLQLGQRQVLVNQARSSQSAKTLLPAQRGAIRDVRGNVLATSIPVKTVCADPSLLGTQQVQVARILAPVLRMKEPELCRCLAPRCHTNAAGKLVTNAYVVLQRKVPLQQWQQVTQAMSGLSLGLDERKLRSRQRLALQAIREKAIFAEDDQLRLYPGNTLAAHVLGFATSSEEESDEGRVTAIHGVDGVELTLDQALSGVHGWRKPGEAVAPRPGLDVVLTLEAGVQHLVEAELEEAMRKHNPASAAAIVVRPRTGEILALANLPVFDPNRPAGSPVDHLRNRILTDPSEPGSTFKVVVIAGALNSQVVTLEDRLDCENGRFVYAGRTLHDHASYGVLSVEEIVTHSSNIGAAKVGLRLGPERLYSYMTNFGFAARTGIPLAGESPGYLRRVDRWEKLSITRIPMGHELLVTPLQMVMSVAALANEGRLMRPMLVDRLEDRQGRLVRKFQPELVRQVISPGAARQMIRALKTVVMPQGTAPLARLAHYTAAGKTGTAEKFVNGTYKSGRYYSSFIGFFPADNPELCISVVLDDPEKERGHYGGTVAGPVFKAIAERVASYLRLPPELPTEVPERARPKTPEATPELAAGPADASRLPVGNAVPRLAHRP